MNDILKPDLTKTDFNFLNNLHCANDGKKIKLKFHRGKIVIDLCFISKEHLEDFNVTKNINSFLTKQKEISCCFELKGRQDKVECR